MLKEVVSSNPANYLQYVLDSGRVNLVQELLSSLTSFFIDSFHWSHPEETMLSTNFGIA